MLNHTEQRIYNAFKLLENTYAQLKDTLEKLNKDDKQRLIKDYANIYNCSVAESTRAINHFIKAL